MGDKHKSSAEPVHQGWLGVTGLDGSGMLSRLKVRSNQRWVVCSKGFIYFFRSNEAKEPTHIISTDLTEVENMSLVDKFSFELVTPDRCIRVSASTEQQLVDWVNAIMAHKVTAYIVVVSYRYGPI